MIEPEGNEIKKDYLKKRGISRRQLERRRDRLHYQSAPFSQNQPLHQSKGQQGICNLQQITKMQKGEEEEEFKDDVGNVKVKEKWKSPF